MTLRACKRCKKLSRPTKLTMIACLHVLCHRLAHCVLKTDSTLNPPTCLDKYKALVHQQNTTEKIMNLFAEKAFTALGCVEIACYLTELFPFSPRIFPVKHISIIKHTLAVTCMVPALANFDFLGGIFSCCR